MLLLKGGIYMTFIGFVGMLIFYNLVFMLIYMILQFPVTYVLLPLAIRIGEDGSAKPRSKILLKLISIFNFFYNTHIFGTWAAFLCSFVIVITRSDSVSFDLLYYVIGFFSCVGAPGYMASKGEKEGNSYSEVWCILFSGISFIVFSIFPQYIWIFGWILNYTIYK